MLSVLRNCWFALSYKYSVWRGDHEPLSIVSAASFGVGNRSFCKEAVRIVIRLTQAGFSAYLVGGCVRDVLCGVIPKDYDIVTDADPSDIRKLFRRSRIIGRRFRLVHVYSGQQIFEVNTFRARQLWLDSWLNGFRRSRWAHNNTYGTIEQDVWRRDFSINALYYDAVREEIWDYVGGIAAIKARQLVCIGVTKKRMENDPVRLLRALRFHIKTQFTMHPDILKALLEQKQLIQTQSKERVYMEVVKFFASGSAKAAWSVLKRYHILQQLFGSVCKELHNQQGEVFVEQWMNYVDQTLSKEHEFAQGVFFSGLLWPYFVTQEPLWSQKGPEGYALFLKQAQTLLTELGKTLVFPRMVEKDMVALWKLQYHFQHMQKEHCQGLMLKRLFQYALALLKIRAVSNAALVDTVVYWSEP